MDNQNGQPAEVENYPLDDATVELMADYQKAAADLEKQAILINGQRQGALVLFIRQHKLPGNWKLAGNGRELEQVKEPAPAPVAVQP